MEGFLQAIGGIGLVLLVVIGLLAGWLASVVAGGRNRAGYLVLGVLAAVATPFVLAAIGVGVLAAGGLAAILVAAIFGAVVVLVLAKFIFD
ncbi:MAG: GlsB/YeaQ/YmgE family stress response membrane protein [Rhodobacteraceae bacterium]|uniref:GlsB/YeaQ/YmgE family stress response membrane protein n=1 Tax=Amaricoccus sp. B4 TaxID=3368557 RepID=UPI000DACD1BE|nr:GlsB/YeaQ/YmgE family stress response membrane protein [Paracoccaceae bacterium]